MATSTAKRECFNAPDQVLNGTAPHVAKVGDYLFSSTVNGRDELDAPKVTEMDAQIENAFKKLEGQLAAAGSSKDELGLLTIHAAEGPEVKAAIHREWNNLFADGQGPATHVIVPFGGFPKPDTFIGIQFVAKSGATRTSTIVDGQWLDGAFPHVVTLDDTVFSSGINGRYYADGSVEKNPAVQIPKVFDYLQERLDAVGATRTDVGYVRNYVRYRPNRQIMDAEFKKFFGSEMHQSTSPTRNTYIQPNLPENYEYEISHFIAVLDSKPEGFFVESDWFRPHGEPITDICRRGSLLLTSRLSGQELVDGGVEDDPDKQTANLFENLHDHVKAAGASLDNIGKVNMWVQNNESKDLALREWKNLFGTAEDGARDTAPARTFILHPSPGQGAGLLIKMELLGAF